MQMRETAEGACMRFTACFVLFSSFLFAKGWTGTLVDSDCKDAHADQACPVTASTHHYGAVTHGVIGHHYYKFAQEGNEKVAAALADRQKKDGRFPQGTGIRVWFTGAPNGDRLELNDFAVK